MSTAPLALRRFGATDSRVTPIFGPVAGELWRICTGMRRRNGLSPRSKAAFDSTVSFIDTSNGYGEDGTTDQRCRPAPRGTPDGVSRPLRRCSVEQVEPVPRGVRTGPR